MFSEEGITRMSSVALSPKYDGVSLYERVSYNGRVVMVLRISHEESAIPNKILEKSSVEMRIPSRFSYIDSVVYTPETETLLDGIGDFKKYREYTEIVYNENQPMIKRGG